MRSLGCSRPASTRHESSAELRPRRSTRSYTPRVPVALCLTAPLLLAGVLIVSAIGKLRDPARSREAFATMGVPAWLNRPWLSRTHPWAEIALAVLLLVVPGRLGVLVAVLTLLLMLVYLALVVRALRLPVDVDCACFGSFGGERVTAGTAWRNLWLVGIAGVSVASAASGTTVASRVGALGATNAWWLVSVLAGAVTVWLVLGTGGRQAEPGAPEVEEFLEVEGDYVRSRTPALPVTLADGTTTTLRELSRLRAQLLIYVSEGCGSCQDTIAAVPRWRRELPQLDVRLVVAVAPEVTRLTSTDEPLSIHDTERLVWDSFAMGGTPSAVLLGADGLLAGGPVLGHDAVPEFVDEIKHELRVAP